MKTESMASVDRKSRISAVAGTLVFLFIAPGTVAGLVPWWIGQWSVHAPFFGFTLLRIAGGLLIAVAAVILIDAFLRFALQGIGTPSPVFPTRCLVVTGAYRFVRNPMYVAVVSMILGQSFLFGDLRIFAYGLACWLAMHLFVLIYEEPTLRRNFPEDYAIFTENIPRWIPRLTPWHQRA
jgi:protein-S-isoprenylcysteine O-methyltransferase Ste14